MEIQRAYSQWVGGRFFPTVADFVREAQRLGVSRRLPNLRTAKEVALPGTVIFLLHDDGQKAECLKCIEAVVCPECGGQNERCLVCKDLGSIERGTGGRVKVDGQEWSYLEYVKLRRRPWDRFWTRKHKVGKVKLCQACSGRGRTPVGVIFGFFVPSAVEYVLRAKEKRERLVLIESSGVKTVTQSEVEKEPRRSDRTRKAGAFYAVTKPPAGTTNGAREVVEQVVYQLVETGKILGDNVEFAGRFVRFPEPIPYRENLFRGLKRFPLETWAGVGVLEGKE